MESPPIEIPRLPWRVLRSGAGTPSWNMALDEALLELARDDDPPLLRLYRWRPAALSLGRFQPAREATPPPGAVLVRRLTGGAAILHQEDEVTYAVVAPYRAFGGRSPRLAYHAVHGLIAGALRSLGVPLAPRDAPGARAAHPTGRCYDQATDYDLVAGGRKLVGSAQRRQGARFLQHGSLPRSLDPASPGATALAALIDPAPSQDAVEEAIIRALSSVAASVRHDALHETHRAAAERIERSRYADAGWTLER